MCEYILTYSYSKNHMFTKIRLNLKQQFTCILLYTYFSVYTNLISNI